MKAALPATVGLCLILRSTAQSPEVLQYADRQLLLVNPQPGNEAVLPMVLVVDGTQKLEFVPVSRIKEFLDHGAQPVRLGDVRAALKQDSDTIAQLQAENERLWKVARKDAPQPQPQTVVVQAPATSPARPTPQDTRLERYMLLRSLLSTPTQTYNVNMTV
jgi:hypothetical protein